MNKKNWLLLFFIAAFIAAVVFLRAGGYSLNSANGFLLPIVVAAALVDSFNPCAFSVLLLTIAFLFSLSRQRKEILQVGAAYIFGVFGVYVLIGLGILKTLELFNVPHALARVGAIVIIIFGAIDLLGEIFPAFPIKLKILDSGKPQIAKFMEKASVPAAIVLGVLVGLFEFPCTGGPYLLVLSLLHDQSTYIKGLSYLFLYNLIFVLPLVLILFAASNEVLLSKVQAWRKGNIGFMRYGSGSAMIVLGVIILLLV